LIAGDRVRPADVIQQDMQLTDEQWSVVQPLIPTPKVRKDGKGRPRVDARSVLDDLPAKNWTTAT